MLHTDLWEDLKTRSQPFFLSVSWCTRSSRVPLVTSLYTVRARSAEPMQCAMDRACTSHLQSFNTNTFDATGLKSCSHAGVDIHEAAADRKCDTDILMMRQTLCSDIVHMFTYRKLGCHERIAWADTELQALVLCEY